MTANGRKLSLAATLAAPLVSLLAGVAAIAFLDSAASAHGGFAAGEPGKPGAPTRVVEVVMREMENGRFVYEPAVIEATKGEQIKIVLKNDGELAHEFLLDSFENNQKHKALMEKFPEMEHDEPNGKRLEAKSSDEILWKFTHAGRFEYGCLIPGHYEAGMHGTVVVK